MDGKGNYWKKQNRMECKARWNRYVEETADIKIHFKNEKHLRNYFNMLNTDTKILDIPMPPVPIDQQPYATRNKSERKPSTLVKQQKNASKKRKKIQNDSMTGANINTGNSNKKKNRSGKSTRNANSSSSSSNATTTAINKSSSSSNATTTTSTIIKLEKIPDDMLYPLGHSKNPSPSIYTHLVACSGSIWSSYNI
jgi:hypothetical protein